MDTQRNLLAALLAVQNELVSLEDVRSLFPRWQAEGQGEFVDWLSRQGKLASGDVDVVQQLVREKLEWFDGDVQAGLKSLNSTIDWQGLSESQVVTVGAVSAGMVLPPAVAPVAVPSRPAAGQTQGSDNTAGSGRRYVRMRLHAAGGIGQVFLARDTQLDRDVALKELKPDAARDPSMGWRFLKEAHITGQLEHPGVVPVYELVQGEDGNEAPYYVMRFLRGKTLSQAIAEYHQKRKTEPATLERASLLNVFSTVCQTVAFAHSRGIVHRDLKGANILLGDFGEVAVLDWGLAKKIGGGEDSTSKRERNATDIKLDQSFEFERTLEGQVLGTPYYMSPEQATGQAVDARSDVYSLGAILYEILTGQPPFAEPDNKQLSIRELLGRIASGVPAPPRQLRADTPPALEAICLQAMAKDPHERYAGAAELRQEVQRWLADEPVHAYPEPLTARLGRWARRNRILVTSIGVVLGITVIGLSIFTVLLGQEQKRTEDARARAEANFKKARAAVDEYLTKVGEERLLDEPGLQDLRRELLASALKFYDDFARALGDDPAGRLDLGEAQLKLADIHMRLGERKEAIKVLEQARDLFLDLLAKDPGNDVYRYNLGRCYHDIGTQVLRLKGPGDESQQLVEKARAELAEVVKQKPVPAYRNFLAEAHNSLSNIFINRWIAKQAPTTDELFTRSMSEQQAAVDLWRQLVKEQPDKPDWKKSLASGLSNLAIRYEQLGDNQKAEESLAQAVKHLEELVEKHPKSIEYKNLLGAVYRNLGWHHRSLGDRTKAADYLRRAVAVRYNLARKNPHLAELQLKAADDCFFLGKILYEQGIDLKDDERQKKLEQARDAYQRSIDVYQRLVEDHENDKRYLVALGEALSSMGDVVYEKSKIEAITWYDKGIDRLESALKQNEKSAHHQLSLARAHERRGVGRLQQRHLQPALSDLDRAVVLHVGDQRKRVIELRDYVRGELIVELTRGKNDFQGAASHIALYIAEPLTPRAALFWARHLAVCADMADDAKSPLANQYAAQAVDLLRQARKGGLFDAAENVKNAAALSVFPALSRRPDFQELLREFKKK